MIKGKQLDSTEEIDTLIEQALSEGLFYSYGEALTCANLAGKPDIRLLEMTVKIRRKHKVTLKV